MFQTKNARQIRRESIHAASKRWIVLSWISPFLAFGVVAFLFTSSIGQGSPSRSARSASQLICTVSSFFSIDANEQAAGTIHVEGRGLASCKNEQGFVTETPVFADLDARVVGNWANAGELSFSANSSSFVIPQEIAQIQDSYTPKTFGQELDRPSPTVLFEGAQHNLMIDMKLTTSTDAFQKLEITSLKLRFDENAPTLD